MLRVLVADDDLGTRETFQAALRHAGYEVDVADSGRAAITALSSGRPVHAQFLDLNLGDMTGYDVLRWMRAQPVAVPTAAMTAFRAAFEPDEAIALGALCYADQPLSIDDIVALAQNLTAPPSVHDDPLGLHRRYLSGHPGALDCLAHVLLRTLPPRLEHSVRAPRDFAEDATTDALLEYIANPTRFDPSRSASIVDFVFLMARRNLLNRVRSEVARKCREERYAADQRGSLHSDRDIDRLGIDVWALLMEMTIDARERRAAELWLDESDNDAIAQALGLGHLPAQEQRREARRFKDRMLKRISRHFRGLQSAYG